MRFLIEIFFFRKNVSANYDTSLGTDRDIYVSDVYVLDIMYRIFEI
jgi:hypothetical protein